VAVIDSDHPILHWPNTIAAAELDGWGSSTHGYLVDLPPLTQPIIASEPSGEPATVEFGLGGGCVLATAQPLEWAWTYDYSRILEDVLLYRCPSLFASKVYESTCVAGTVLTYTLTVTNEAEIARTGVVVSDTLPAGLTYLDGDGSFDGTDVTWALTPLAPSGGQASVWLSVRLPCQAELPIVNDTYGIAGVDKGLAAAGEPISFQTIAPTINVSLSYVPDPVVEGEVINFTASVSSDGTETTGEWDFGAGPVSGGLTVTHTFADAGTYTVYYTATDVCGFSQAASATILVEEATWDTYLPLVMRNH
jgi:uncharacterized repeat protein (TIGR01451 family)